MDRFQAIQNNMRSLFQNLGPVIPGLVPIGLVTNHNRSFEGTGVYVRVGGRFFLVTAGHIAQHTGKLLVQLSQSTAGSIPTKRFFGYGGPADVAVAELESPLEPYQPIDASQLKYFRDMRDRGLLVVCGYPASKAKVSWGRMSVNLYSFLTREEKDAYAEYTGNPEVQFDPRHSLILEYDKKNMMGVDLKRTTTPDPTGMSGGGLFWIPEAGLNGQAAPVLVGIMTRWEKGKSRVFATQLSLFFQLMREHFYVV